MLDLLVGILHLVVFPGGLFALALVYWRRLQS